MRKRGGSVSNSRAFSVQREAKATLLREQCGGATHLYEAESGSNSFTSTLTLHSRVISSIRQFFYEAFLPMGYPQSTSDDYLEYQIWDSLQAGCSSLIGILASRAVLQGVGVGNENATATGAVINWMLRDGAGMLGKITFTWFEGSSLDLNPKMWRMMADILNDISFFVDILSPMAPPQYFLPMVSCSAVMRSIVGVAGGVSRTALTQHQARRNNIADVAAKDGSQETAISLIMLIVGLFVTPLIETPTAVWTSFIILSILHLFFNYKAVSSVVSDKINRFRLEHLTTQFDLNPAQPLPNPKELAAREPIFDLSYFSSKKRVELGVRPSTIPPFAFTDIDALPPKRYQIAFPEVEYLIPDVKEPRSVLFTFSGVPVFLLFVESENSIKVALNSYPSSFPTNLIESLALFIAQMLASVQERTSTPITTLIPTRLASITASYKEFLDEVKRRGWDSTFVLAAGEWRYDFVFSFGKE